MRRDLKSRKGGWGEDVKACSMFEDSWVLVHSWEVAREEGSCRAGERAGRKGGHRS